MIDPRLQAALDRFPETVEERIPDALPLLDDFREDDRDDCPDFLNVELLAIQHHLGPYVRRLEAMFEDGLLPERTWLVDIPYSTNETVRQEIVTRFGIPRTHTSPPFKDPLAPYSIVQLRRVEETLYRLVHSMSGSRLLVVDDGAYFIRALRNLEYAEPGIVDILKDRTFIVEQTTRGHRYYTEPQHAPYRRLAEDVLRAPVVSIAKSNTKIDFEGPFIGKAAERAVKKGLEKEGVNLSGVGSSVGVIGFGPVGEAVFRAIKSLGHEGAIQVIEIDQSKHEHISRLGGEPHASLHAAGSFDILFGCTGKTSFKLSHWDLLSDNAYLISTSSAAVEFNRKNFIDLAELRDDDEYVIVDSEATREEGLHVTVRIRDVDRSRQVNFVNASFPVNFDGRMECLPWWAIQATHTLLYAAGDQVLATSQPGFYELNSCTDAMINESALRQLPG